ncbi:hypothetical protein AVEN_87147-1 [Araneus ventricosus]|uniref:Uncharacterized protein n=1 Tax=Araneus ventricosus TaxID=182803 RepID=A0A4Y2UCQ3_ARAVE|nr:hypothetical protein AVEN_87147-1 [Araneus ventricosus]
MDPWNDTSPKNFFEIEKFCDVELTSSEHVDTRPSRIARDNEDAAKVSQWLSEHNPFSKIDVIMSIDSGIVGGNEVNCHLSEEIGRDDFKNDEEKFEIQTEEQSSDTCFY